MCCSVLRAFRVLGFYRMQGTMSTFGAFLDPVADKLMVAAVLVIVASRPLAAGPLAGNAWLVPALAIGAPPAGTDSQSILRSCGCQACMPPQRTHASMCGAAHLCARLAHAWRGYAPP